MLKRIKKLRVAFLAIVLVVGVIYAQKAGPGNGQCKGCGGPEICFEGGNYTGTGWSDCDLRVWPDGSLHCEPYGTFGWCTYNPENDI